MPAGYSSAAAFARELGVQEETYRGWERGRTEPNIGQLCRIIALTKVEANFLLGLGDPNAEEEEIAL